MFYFILVKVPIIKNKMPGNDMGKQDLLSRI